LQILGLKEQGNLPPDLRFLERQLSTPPFTAWKSFRLLSRTDLQMSQDEPKQMLLVTGHKLQLVFLGLEGKKLRLRLTIGPKVLDVTYRINPRGTFLQIGLPYEKGTLIVATTCNG